MGRWHASYARRLGARVVGVVDPHRSLAGARRFERLGAALSTVQPDIAHICTPTETHVDMVHECLVSCLRSSRTIVKADGRAMPRPYLKDRSLAGSRGNACLARTMLPELLRQDTSCRQPRHLRKAASYDEGRHRTLAERRS